MQTTTEKTVREIAAENPASVRIFESLGIDYCCGGKKSLTEACRRADLDVDRVLLLLEKARRDSASDEPDWKDKPLGELMAHIVTKHHGFVRQETPRIESLLLKVISKHGPAHPELAQVEQLFTAMSQELSTHMMKEEQVLFPYIERMEQAAAAGETAPPAFFGSVKRPIANMMAEHDDAGALLTRIRELTGDYSAPAGACPTFQSLYRALEEFERDLHHHVHLENNLLFPRAAAMEEGN